MADSENHRLSVFNLTGEFVKTIGSKALGVMNPCDVVECPSDGSFIVSCCDANMVMKLSATNSLIGVVGRKGSQHGQFTHPLGVLALPGDGLVVQDDSRLQVFGDIAEIQTALVCTVPLDRSSLSSRGGRHAANRVLSVST